MMSSARVVGRPMGGEVASVTGASSGIGAATAGELARRGAVVVRGARRIAELEVQARAIGDAGGEALAIPTDVADPADVAFLVERTLDGFGRVDVLVNNAGAGWLRPLASSPPGEISGLVAVNLLCAMRPTRAVLPGMPTRRHGAGISFGSTSVQVGVAPLLPPTRHE